MGCCLLPRLLLWAGALLWGSPQRALGPFFLSLSCAANCKCQRRGLTCDAKVLRPKKPLLLAKCALSSKDGRSQRGRGSPQPHSHQMWCFLSARTPKEQSTPVFPAWAGLECGKASLHLHQLGASSQLKLPLRFGVYKSGVSFGFIDPSHGTKQ